MPQAVDCDLLLYADDSCLVFRDNNINEIEKQPSKDFNSFCDWLVDNKLTIHFGEDKIKSILFGSKIIKDLAARNLISEEVTSRSNNTPQCRIWAASLMRACLVSGWQPGP